MAESAGHVFGSMGMFDPERGDNWPMYTERMEHCFAANSIDSEAKKKAVFLTVIGPGPVALALKFGALGKSDLSGP